jgi:AraC-like DNA-binding protein
MRIGKTRHPVATGIDHGESVSVIAGVGKARGLLQSAASPGRFRHERHAPAAPLQPFVEHYWMVQWDLRGHPPQLRETLPHPSVHLLMERGRSRIAGVARGRFSRLLEDEGQVFGVKFKPGGFQPFLGASVSTITDRSLALAEVFGDSATTLEERILGEDSMLGMIDVATQFLSAHLPPCDPQAERATDIVFAIMADQHLTSVETVAARHATRPRALQRLFARYVGVSPKWVIHRYRLHEALEQLAAGRPADWPALVLSLGYYDQAHFIRDFKRMIGKTPTEYTHAHQL